MLAAVDSIFDMSVYHNKFSFCSSDFMESMALRPWINHWNNHDTYVLHFIFLLTDDEETLKDSPQQVRETSFEDACKEYQQRCLFLLLGVTSAITGNMTYFVSD